MKPEPKAPMSDRFSATVEPDTLAQAKVMAKLCGFAFSFSAYVNEALKRDIQSRRNALSLGPASH